MATLIGSPVILRSWAASVHPGESDGGHDRDRSVRVTIEDLLADYPYRT